MDPITEDLNKEMLSDIYNLKKKLKMTQLEISDLQMELSRLRLSLLNSNNKVEELEKKNGELQLKFDDLEKKNISLEEKNISINQKYDELLDKKNTLENQYYQQMQLKKHEKVWSTTDFLDEFNMDLNKSNGYQPRFSYSNNSSFFSNHLNNISNTRKDLTLTNGSSNGHSIDDTSATTIAMKLKQNQGSFSDISTTKSPQYISNTTTTTTPTSVGTNGNVINGYTTSSPKIVVKEIHQPMKSNNTHSLYVAGLYKGLAQADLKKYFEKYGKIEKVTVPQVVDNIVDGQKYLFIRFEECSSVDKILQQDYHTIKDVSVRTKPGKNV